MRDGWTRFQQSDSPPAPKPRRFQTITRRNSLACQSCKPGSTAGGENHRTRPIRRSEDCLGDSSPATVPRVGGRDGSVRDGVPHPSLAQRQPSDPYDAHGANLRQSSPGDLPLVRRRSSNRSGFPARQSAGSRQFPWGHFSSAVTTCATATFPTAGHRQAGRRGAAPPNFTQRSMRIAPVAVACFGDLRRPRLGSGRSRTIVRCRSETNRAGVSEGELCRVPRSGPRRDRSQ